MTMFELVWTPQAAKDYARLKAAAQKAVSSRRKSGRSKSSKQEGLHKQVHKALRLLSQNPKHPSLQTYEFHSLEHPYDSREKVFEAYAQSKTASAYRIFWCYGPEKRQRTIIAITPHP